MQVSRNVENGESVHMFHHPIWIQFRILDKGKAEGKVVPVLN